MNICMNSESKGTEIRQMNGLNEDDNYARHLFLLPKKKDIKLLKSIPTVHMFFEMCDHLEVDLITMGMFLEQCKCLKVDPIRFFETDASHKNGISTALKKWKKWPAPLQDNNQTKKGMRNANDR